MATHDDERGRPGRRGGGAGARRARAGALGVAALAAVLAAAACSSSTSSGGTSAAGAGGGKGAAGGGSCGTYPSTMPSDPDGALASLPANIRAAYAGYSTPVHKSPWASWKPKSSGLVVGVSWTNPINDFAADTLSTVKSGVAAIPGVSKVVVLAGAAPGDVPAQIQQYQSLVQQKVGLIVADVSAGSPLVSAVNAAAKAGIPTISALNTIPTANSVNVVPANYVANAQTMAAEMKAIHGSGSVLEVHGIPGISIDSDAFRAFGDVIARCPDVKVAGTITGNFAPAAAKSAVLQFLGTHPGSVEAVAQAGGMTAGIMEAFQSLGRPVPIVNDVAAVKGSLGYWLTHKSSYTGTGTGGGAAAFGQLVTQVAQHMIAGDGVQISDILQTQPLITQDNIGQWADSSWNLQTTGTAPDPAGTVDNPAIISAVFGKAAS